MRKSRLSTLLLFISVTFFPCISLCTDQYWISYSGDEETEYRSLGPKYLMKIDVLGNVLVQPTKVVRNSSVFVSTGSAATALSPGGLGRIQMWFATKGILPGGNRRIFKAVIEKSSVRLVSMGQTKLSTSNIHNISITQKPRDNFIILQVLTSFPPAQHDWIAYSASRGLRTKWILQVCPDGVDCRFGLSADGRVLFYSKRKESGGFEVFFQPLSPGGLLVGEPEMIARGGNLQDPLRAFDVSSILGQGRRYFLYQGGGASVFLQVVDGKTGKKLGERIRVAGNVGEAVVDPLGRFAIYATGVPSARPVVFQALDGLGNPSGSPKTIAKGIGSGVDIMKD